jgi:hypothetical protein
MQSAESQSKSSCFHLQGVGIDLAACFEVGFLLGFFLVLKIGVACSSETSVCLSTDCMAL